MQTNIKVLVLEDSSCFIASLNKDLNRFGYILDYANNIDEALTLASVNFYKIIIIDVAKINNCELFLFHRYQVNSQNSVILSILTNEQISQRVKSLETGANDYMVKPFTYNDLVVRLNTLVRCKDLGVNTEIQLGNIKVNTSIKKVQCMGSEVELTPSEYKVMEKIVKCKGRVISKSQLEDVLYEAHSNACSNVVEVIVSNLRKKIKMHGAELPIKTRRGFGYYAEA